LVPTCPEIGANVQKKIVVNQEKNKFRNTPIPPLGPIPRDTNATPPFPDATIVLWKHMGKRRSNGATLHVLTA
jgi:hypothetical protein